MEYKDVLLGLVSKTLNLDNEKVASTLFNEDESIKDNALELLLEMDKERVKNLKGSDIDIKAITTEAFDNGFKKAEKEKAKKFEALLKEKSGIDTELKGEELVEHLVKKLSSKSGGKEITEDDIKRSKPFIDLQENLKSEISKIDADWKARYDNRENEWLKQSNLKVVTDKAKSLLLDMKPVLSENQLINDTRINNYLNEFNSFDFEMQDGRVVVIKDGKVLENEHGARVDFETVVKNLSHKHFEFQKQEPKKSAGNNTPDNILNVSSTPTTEEEYINSINQAKTSEERIAITEAWKSRNN